MGSVLRTTSLSVGSARWSVGRARRQALVAQRFRRDGSPQISPVIPLDEMPRRATVERWIPAIVVRRVPAAAVWNSSGAGVLRVPELAHQFPVSPPWIARGLRPWCSGPDPLPWRPVGQQASAPRHLARRCTVGQRASAPRHLARRCTVGQRASAPRHLAPRCTVGQRASAPRHLAPRGTAGQQASAPRHLAPRYNIVLVRVESRVESNRFIKSVLSQCLSRFSF